MVSSPAMVPTASVRRARSSASANTWGLSAAGADHHQLLHAIDAEQELGSGALERNQRRFRIGRLGAGALIGAVTGALDEAELGDVARDRRLRGVEPLLVQTAPQQLLAVERARGRSARVGQIGRRRFHRGMKNDYTSIFVDRKAPFMYKYSFSDAIVLPRPRVVLPRPRMRRRSGRSAGADSRIAGATGYTGQELLRLLSRHPAGRARRGDVVGAGPAPRRGDCPAFTRPLWDGR